MAEIFRTVVWVYLHPQETLLGLIAACAVVLVLLFLINRVPVSYNVLNLMVRWKNTAMTALAFTMVIGLLIVMLGFVNGMYALTQNSGQPGNLLILAEGATDESFSNLGFADLSDLENQRGIVKDADGQPLTSRETYLIASQPILNPQPGRPKRRFLQVRGVDDAPRSARVHNMELQPGGEWFSSAGVREVEGRNGLSLVEVVLGNGIAGELGADRSPEELAKAKNKDRLDTGDIFHVGDREWIVAGVLKPSGSTYDSEVWAKQSLIGPMFGKSGCTTLVARTFVDKSLVEDAISGKLVKIVEAPTKEENGKTVKVGEDTQVPLVWLTEEHKKLLADRVKELPADNPEAEVSLTGLPPRTAKALHDAAATRLKTFFTTEYEKAAVAPQVESEYFANLSSTNIQFLVAIAVVTCIMSLGGIFGVMNTMFAAISQRTKDIGVLRLLGYKRWQILVSFLLESLVLAVFGGIIGCLIGSLADGFTANSIVTGGPGGGGKFVVLRITIDSVILGCGLLLSIGMGFLGGLIPAFTAMRLTALEALR
ncbi:MAG: ABC transporter permease [Planctomycetaceae bacterium]|nr:ABC transporter permease [Planctomycetaceae bacterium]